MQRSEVNDSGSLPLAGCRVIERSRGAAAAYAGRLLATLGAEVIMVEPPGGSPLRSAPPFVDDGEKVSALFSYLAVGKRSLVCDLDIDTGRQQLESELGSVDIFIDDTPVAERPGRGIAPDAVCERFPDLIYTSVLPFGASGPKSDWDGEEVNLIHASGEGFLLPNGYSHELFPDRPPLKIYGHFAEYQGGCVAALSALSGLWAVPEVGGQFIDISVQDSALLCGAFALQRLGDGSLEHRATRSFRYGGVFETKEGYVELLTLEDRQWQGLVSLLGSPEWALDEALQDPLERSVRGAEINAHIRQWMLQHHADEIVAEAQQLGVPIARYRTPADIVSGEHERSRGLFATACLSDGTPAEILLAPYRFRYSPLELGGEVPQLGEMGQMPAREMAQ